MMRNYLTLGEFSLFRVGLGTNRIHLDERSHQALKKAVSLGVNFIDTASVYTGGESETAIGSVLGSNTGVIIATKGGMVSPDYHIDSSPQMLAKQLETSLKKLQRKHIDLYFLHRVDPNVPLKESLLFLKQMQEEGKIKHIGISHVSLAQIEEARKYITVAAVENEFNLSNRESDTVVDYCEKENIIFISYYPLHVSLTDHHVLAPLQEKYQATEAQLALAWLLKRSPVILPIPGSTDPGHIEENVAAAQIDLRDEDFAKLSALA